MSKVKEQAMAIFQQHIEVAKTDGRLFRKLVMEQMMADFGISQASAATHYNSCKKATPVIEGLGRPTASKNVRKPNPGKTQNPIQPDEECFTVIELVRSGADFTVGRCQSFLFQGEAGECFDGKVETWPNSIWIIIQGLGPIHGDTFKLEEGEVEIRRYDPTKLKAMKEAAQKEKEIV